MKRQAIVVVLAAVAAGAILYVAMAAFFSTQSTTGQISVTSSSPSLYICETTNGETCSDDDSGADEIIFEGLEDLAPGNPVFQDILLKNVGSSPWVVMSGTQFSFTEVQDPGADCDHGAPSYRLYVITDPGGDNPTSAEAGLGSNQGLTGFMQGYNPSEATPLRQVRVGPGMYDAVRIKVFFWPGGMAGVAACEGNVWDMTIVWQVG